VGRGLWEEESGERRDESGKGRKESGERREESGKRHRPGGMELRKSEEEWERRSYGSKGNLWKGLSSPRSSEEVKKKLGGS